MISVLFWPIHPPPALLSPSKISRRAQWVVLTLYKLESPGHQEIFFLSFQEDSDVQQNLGNTAIYAFCLGFLSFGLKRQTCSLLFIVKEKKKCFSICSEFRHTAPWSAVFSEEDHITMLGASLPNPLTASHPLSTSFLSSSLFSLVSEITTDQLLSLGVFSSYSSSYL